MNDKCSALDRCRNSFLAALLLVEKGFPVYVLPSWSKAEWTIFIGPESVARNLLLNRQPVLAEAIRWVAFPARDGWLREPYSPEQISEWVLNQWGDTNPIDAPCTEYKNWLKEFVIKLAMLPDGLPTISYSDGSLSAWIHRRNSDLSTKKMPIERYEPSPPLPSGFEEERRLFIFSGSDGLNGGWPFTANEWGVSSKSGFTVPSVGIYDAYDE